MSQQLIEVEYVSEICLQPSPHGYCSGRVLGGNCILVCGCPTCHSSGRPLLTESLAEQVAPLILALDKLQESQLKADITAHFNNYTRRFSSLNNQKHRDKSARNQERRIELKKQLEGLGYEYRPLNFPLEFYITAQYSEKELVSTGTGKKREQIYDTSPSLKEVLGAELGREQSGCLHKVSAPTLQEGSDKALAEHLANCVKGEK